MLPFIFFSLNIENVRECCKAHWVCVDQRIALYKNYLLLLLSVFECKQVCVQHWACLQQVLTLLPWFSWTKKIKCFEEAGSFKLLPEFVDIFVAHFVVVTTHAVRCVCVCVCMYVCEHAHVIWCWSFRPSRASWPNQICMLLQSLPSCCWRHQTLATVSCFFSARHFPNQSVFRPLCVCVCVCVHVFLA